MRLFLFGESEKGEFCTPHRIKDLPQLQEKFGNPAENSIGIDYAVQSILYTKRFKTWVLDKEAPQIF
jgi:hypothetical protein